MPDGQDHWWSLRPGDDAEGLADEVAAAVRDYLLPAVRAEVAATSNGALEVPLIGTVGAWGGGLDCEA